MPDAVQPVAKAEPRIARTRATRRPAAKGGTPGHGDTFPVVAIGASAGGLEACKLFLDALPAATGMAFLLVQHLDPTHPSLLVKLLAKHTALTVLHAAEGMPLAPEHLYVIPPGSYLTVRGGALHLSPPDAARGARMPFDVLLRSLAVAHGAHAACVVLSGTGADGTAGLRVLKDAGGVVLVQDPAQADYDGMPRSAISTGVVDTVAPAAALPAALLAALGSGGPAAAPAAPVPAAPVPAAPVPAALDPAAAKPTADAPASAGPDPFLEVIALLRAHTGQDFAPYKRGTLERRVERRMVMAGAGTRDGKDGLGRYLGRLRADAGELDLLAKDLLIHVTSFFRDPDAFAALADRVIPGLLEGRAPDQPIRVWVPGCSTGEEAYSLVMLFREAITKAQEAAKDADPGLRDLKLQVFASDIDADAVATAREGLYPAGIASDVSAARLARFFSKEDGHGYRVLPELRASVVFTVQDLLTDPPFSRLDLVSCRNLMIYLGPEAQAQAVSLFHFALKEGGSLMLGSAETVGTSDGRFELIQKSARLYCQTGRKRPGDLALATVANGPRSSRPSRVEAPSREAALALLCRQAVLDAHAPAAVLCNMRHECMYSLGPTDRYLRVPPGIATPDLLAMARGTVRTRLRSALSRAAQGGTRVVVPGGRMMRDGHAVPFSIDVQPLQGDGEALLLVCFVDAPPQLRGPAAASRDAPRVAELERELDTVRADLDAAVRDLEASSEEQRAVNEEALSVNEEYQSTNEELLTSKEELQSLNEELQALNSQLQETLERQRTTSDDLQNILYSTDVATLFLDRDLNIRFFTPATRALFNVIPGDVGRPLADLHPLATDTLLPADVRAVLDHLEPVEREVETPGGTWFRRRVLPYRTEGRQVQGVVITFNDITRRKREAAALVEAKGGAEAANLAKSRFLAAASHDLRQPLQTLALLQGLLARNVAGDKAAGLVARLDDTLGAMTGMLDTLLDLNQIEAGVVQADVAECRVGPLLDRLRDEFALLAQAKRIVLRVAPCSATIRTDPRLLEQMLRNLVSNALKYTARGRVLLGCRRVPGALRIEVWDTGVGIPAAELQAVFDEYHQLDNAARERSRGLGLGLAIVQRLGALLGHRVQVRSQPGRGSVFSIEVARVVDTPPGRIEAGPGHSGNGVQAVRPARRTGAVLVIEDDPDMRALLRMLLEGEGHAVEAAPDGPAALDMVARGTSRPSLVLADYNLPGGMTGLQAAGRLRDALPGVPVIILTGDTSAATMHDVAQAGCGQLNKPVTPAGLLQMVLDLFPTPVQQIHDATVPDAPAPGAAARDPTAPDTMTLAGKPVIFVVDDDAGIRGALRRVLEDGGHAVEDFSGGGGDCLVAALYVEGQLDLKLLGHGLYALDPARCGLGGVLLHVVLDVARERDHPGVRGDADVGRVDARLSFQLGEVGLLQLTVF